MIFATTHTRGDAEALAGTSTTVSVFSFHRHEKKRLIPANFFFCDDNDDEDSLAPSSNSGSRDHRHFQSANSRGLSPPREVRPAPGSPPLGTALYVSGATRMLTRRVIIISSRPASCSEAPFRDRWIDTYSPRTDRNIDREGRSFAIESGSIIGSHEDCEVPKGEGDV